MTASNRATIAALYQAGDRPSQGDYQDFIDSAVFQVGTSGQTIQSDVSASGKLTCYDTFTVASSAQANLTGNLLVTGTASAASFSGQLNASNLLSGTVAQARLLGYKLVGYTRDVSLAGGAGVQLTGAGFTPRAAIVFMGQSGTKRTSWGFTDGSGQFCLSLDVATGNYVPDGSKLIDADDNAGTTEYSFAWTAWNSNGMTGTWTKTGTPTGTITFYVLYLP